MRRIAKAALCRRHDYTGKQEGWLKMVFGIEPFILQFAGMLLVVLPSFPLCQFSAWDRNQFGSGSLRSVRSAGESSEVFVQG